MKKPIQDIIGHWIGVAIFSIIFGWLVAYPVYWFGLLLDIDVTHKLLWFISTAYLFISYEPEK